MSPARPIWSAAAGAAQFRTRVDRTGCRGAGDRLRGVPARVACPLSRSQTVFAHALRRWVRRPHRHRRADGRAVSHRTVLTFAEVCGEPCLIFDVYVAANKHLTALLEAVLAEGLEKKKVQKHFADSQASIEAFLSESNAFYHPWDTLVGGIDRWKPYQGYTRYAAVGEFEGRGRAFSNMARFVYVPPLKKMAEDLGIAADLHSSAVFLARRYLRFWTHDIVAFRKELRKWPQPKTKQFARLPAKAQTRLLNLLDQWPRTVGFFHTAFVMYKLCAGVHHLHEAGVLKNLEDQLWVISSRDSALSKMALKDQQDPL